MNLPQAVAKALPSVLHSSSPVDQVAYARDLWPRHHIHVRDGKLPDTRPGVIVWPTNTDDVSAIVRFCAAEGVPLVPYGAGSGVCGGVLPNPQTVILDLKKMARWRTLDRSTPFLDVEAGALGIRLEEDLQHQGFTLGHFPSSILCSTPGGWVAARSAGQCSGRYGKIEDMVASLECVTGTGEVVTFQRRASGVDLTPLIIGSEGVLSVITAMRLRLHTAPAARAYGSLSFPTLEAGWEAMRAMFQAGLRPAVARLYDPFDSMMARRGAARAEHAAHHASPAPHPKKRGGAGGGGAFALRNILRAPGALNGLLDLMGSRAFGGAMLVLIFEGAAGEVNDDLAHAEALGRGYGGSPSGEGPAKHWLAHRYSVSYRQAPMFMSGAFVDTMEVAAPWSKLGALYENVRAALGKHVFVMAHLSHAYPDGCSIYFTFAGGGNTAAAQSTAYDAAWRNALDAAIASGGTLSHHHGVGRSKAPALGAELGLGVDVVHALRRAFDPSGVLNPGNLLPREGSAPRTTATAPSEPTLDRTSLLVNAAGTSTLRTIENAVQREGLTLGLQNGADLDMTVAAWIAAGLPGARDGWLDPADHTVAGFGARLGTGAPLAVHPGPRRAVGPDLFALFAGARERVGVITSAWLRVHRHVPVHAQPRTTLPRPLATSLDRSPAVSSVEAAWIDRALNAARNVSDRA
ncbi:MAG: FAD-binding oxidoreductase [Polyangiaceae bacterium]|nr:FAD-binding oxidoreductase [Polyangiaceae bacterium]